jgi:hypothetical protein
MPEIKPLMTKAQVDLLNTNQSPPGDRLYRTLDLPGVTSDAKVISRDRPPTSGPYNDPDAGGFAKNRELAQRIKQALRDLKPQEGGGHFIVAWRLYPNADHPRFQGPAHACGCGCGCGCA